MNLIIGFIVVTSGFIFALNHLNQDISNYWDIIAFSMVVLGTLSVSIITAPPLKIMTLLRFFKNGLKNGGGLREDTINNSMNLFKGKIPNGKVDRFDQKVLVDGLELLRLGYPTEKIEMILRQRIENYANDAVTIAGWVRGLSKYPPAFGLAGTVLGLIHLMNGLSDGSGPKETGMRMAIALIATLYGIIVANIFVNPIGDRLMGRAKEDYNLSEISLETILMISRKTNMITAIETLNNYLPNKMKNLETGKFLAKAS